MKELLKYRDFVYIAILAFVWFMYPRQNSVRKETKPNREEVLRLEKSIESLKTKIRVDSMLKTAYLQDIDSLEKAKQPIYHIIQKNENEIKKILDSPNLADSALYKFFTNINAKSK